MLYKITGCVAILGYFLAAFSSRYVVGIYQLWHKVDRWLNVLASIYSIVYIRILVL